MDPGQGTNEYTNSFVIDNKDKSKTFWKCIHQVMHISQETFKWLHCFVLCRQLPKFYVKFSITCAPGILWHGIILIQIYLSYTE